ncbi:hypothetical protein [Erysipelatoclostridium sp. An173]|uniref:hypothetical protein n=1 Tax=Erysipelatoclostridium sp. An173 TaxID=1965571 RepID=UPI00320A5A78
MKMKYESPLMFAETFVANQYIAACQEPIYKVEPTRVRCQSPGHQNTQYNTMFLDSQSACVVKFNPGVGSAEGDIFHTQFEACAYKDGCNRQNWLQSHPGDQDFSQHKKEHDSRFWANDGAFIMHDTTIDLSFAEKYQLS